MTRPTLASIGAEKVHEIAERYRGRGYEVTLAPQGDQLPEALRDLPPDLIARKGEDVVVVEVKSRPDLAKAPRASDVARVVREQPGWRFELVIVSPERPFLAPYDAEDWSAEEVDRRLSEAATLLETGHVEAALLLGWAATEATLRLLARGRISPSSGSVRPLSSSASPRAPSLRNQNTTGSGSFSSSEMPWPMASGPPGWTLLKHEPWSRRRRGCCVP